METVTSVEPLADHRLKVAFSTGDVKLFDVTPYLDRGVTIVAVGQISAA